MNIAIYGAGGFGKEVACLIERINRENGDWHLIGFFDDTKPAGTPVSRYGKVLGDMNTLLAVNEPLAVAFAINENKAVRRIREAITNENITFPNLIDPSLFYVDPLTVTIGEGNIIQNHCMISCDVKIGNFNLINDHVVIGHDNIIGDYNGLMPGAHLSGGITIGDSNLLVANCRACLFGRGLLPLATSNNPLSAASIYVIVTFGIGDESTHSLRSFRGLI